MSVSVPPHRLTGSVSGHESAVCCKPMLVASTNTVSPLGEREDAQRYRAKYLMSGISAVVSYHQSLHSVEPFAQLGRRNGDLTNETTNPQFPNFLIFVDVLLQEQNMLAGSSGEAGPSLLDSKRH